MSGSGSSGDGDLYGLLGVGRDVSEEDLKKAYRRAALLAHPDKPGGSKEKFQAVNEAYQVLSNAAARAEYDRTGRVPRDGEAPPPPADISEILGSLFGSGGFPIPMMFAGGGGFGSGGFGSGGFGSGGPPGTMMRRARGPNKVHEIGVSLADLWSGKVFTLKMKREVLCGGCDGKGGTDFRACEPCSGRGFRVVRQQMGPMVLQSQEGCGSCRGEGRVVGTTCVDCSGRRVVETEKSLEVRVERGMTEGDRIVFPEACSESPDFEKSGDLVLVLRAAAGDPAVVAGWERRGTSLVMEVSLSVAESLLGWERLLEGHPSGKSVPVVWESGVVREGEVLRVPEWGMPLAKETGRFGDLLLVCRIRSQEGTWSEEQRRALQAVWPEWCPPTRREGAHLLERVPTTVAP